MDIKKTESFEILITEIFQQMKEPYYDTRRRLLVKPSKQGLIHYEHYLNNHFGKMDFICVKDFSKKVYCDINKKIKTLTSDENADFKELKRVLIYCFNNINTQNIDVKLNHIALSKTTDKAEDGPVLGL